MAGFSHHPDLAVDTRSTTSHPFWHEIRTLGAHPQRRSYHSAVAWNNRMIINGGQDLREGMVPGLWVFTLNQENPDLDTWEEIPETQNSPPPLSRHSAVVDGDQMILFGGTDNSVDNANAYILNLRDMLWSVKNPDSPALPPPIDSHSAVVWNRQMVVFGGFINGSRSNTVFVLDLTRLIWSEPAVSGSIPAPRSGHSAVVHRDHVFVYGGTNDDGNKLNDMWKFDPNYYAWERLPVTGSVPEGRSGHSVCVYASCMIMFGGMKDLTKETNEMYGFKFDSLEWDLIQEEKKIEDPVSAVQLEEYKRNRSPSHKSVMPAGSPNTSGPARKPGHGGSPVSPGDESPGKRKRPTTHLYEGPPSPMLGRIVGRAPYPRDGHSAILLGDKMMVFGGDRYQMPFNDLYIFAINSHSVRLVQK